MKPFLFNVGQTSGGLSVFAPVRQWFKEEFSLYKFNSTFGYLFWSGIAFLVAYLVGRNELSFSLSAFAIVFLGPMLLGALFNLNFGIGLMMVSGFAVFGLKRMFPEQPLELFLDTTLFVMLFGLFVKQSRWRDISFIENPVSLAIFIWAVYSVFELTNPWARSTLAWYYATRSLTGIWLMFFVAMYSLKKPMQLRWLMRLWIALAIVSSLYGISQQLFGLSSFEWRWLMDDVSRFDDFYALGRIRKFSFFMDPATFGIVMAISALLSIGLIFGIGQKRSRMVLLGMITVILILGMIVSGTRTAFIMFPAGYVFLAFLTLDKKVITLGGIGLAMVLALLFIPSDSYHLIRFQSTFHPTEASTFQTRMQNHEFIQPYIRAHPMGIGLGSTGDWGQRFAPDTMLSQFPPDSGYVRVAVEAGWVGLFLYLGLILSVMVVGVRNYFRIQNPALKRYQAVFLSIIFALALANYPQQALIQLPTSIFFVIAGAAVVKIRDFD